MFGSRRTRKGARARALFARFAFRATRKRETCELRLRVGLASGPMASPLSPSTRRRASSVETHAN